jgi:Ca2+-binding EF-hand superfamily protein
MPHATRDLPETDEALDALNAEQMRSLIRALMPWFDDRLYARFVNAAINAAARSSSLSAREGPRRQAPRLHHFEEFDRDGDGLIDQDELVDRLQRGAPIGAARPGPGHRFGPALPPG